MYGSFWPWILVWHAEVDRGHWSKRRKMGTLEIDVHGAMSVLDHFPSAITLFIDPGSQEELEARLRHRATESESALQRRLEVARSEMEFAPRYQHTIVNHAADEAADEICQILMSVGDR